MPTPIGPSLNELTPMRDEADEIQKDRDLSLLTPPNEETGLYQGVEIGPDQGVDTYDLDDQLLNKDQAHKQANEEAYREVEDELERQLQAKLLVPSREITSNIDASNILSGRRIRRAKQDNDFTYITTIVQGIDEEPPALLYAFIASLYAKKPNARRYRDNLLLPLKYQKDIINHPFQ